MRDFVIRSLLFKEAIIAKIDPIKVILVFFLRKMRDRIKWQ